MRAKRRIMILVATVSMAAQWLAAASGIWTGGSGNWSDPGNWAGGVIADGANESATFNNAGAITVTVDTPRTIGQIKKESGEGSVYIVGSKLVTLQDASGATLDAAAGEVRVAAPLAGQAFAKRGIGRVVLASNAVHSITGTMRVDGGELRLESAGHTIPAITQIHVAADKAAARLHYTSEGDAMSVYPCTFRISGQKGLSSGTQTNYGPLFAYGNKIEAAVSNIVLEAAVENIARIGQHGTGGKLEFRGEMSGPAGLELYVNGEKTNDFYGSNSYAGATYVTLANGSSRLVMNLRGPQRLPYSTVVADLGSGGDCVVDMNGHEQKTLSTKIQHGTLTVQSTGATGTWQVGTGYPRDFDVELSEYGRCVVDAGANLVVEGSILNDDSGLLVVSNRGYLYCGEELVTLEQLSGVQTNVMITSGGRVRTRMLGQQFFSPGWVIIEGGGKLEVAAAHYSQVSSAGGIYIDGGTLADWANDDLGGLGRDAWIEENINVYLGENGATINVEHPKGRTLASQIEHQNYFWQPGFWGIVKTGPGDLNLTYAVNRIMHVIVSNGMLRVMDRVYGDDVVVHGGAIGGTGSLPATIVASGGTIAPGDGAGTLTIRNTLTMQSGSIYEWEKDAGVGNADKIVILDGLEIGNAVTVQVVRLPGAVPEGAGVTNTIMEVGGTLSGFDNLRLDMSGAPGWGGMLLRYGQKIGVVLIPED